MKVLVTGAKGQVGTELIRRGRTLGLQMVAAGRSELDITFQEDVHAYLADQSPDIVINGSAYTAVDKAEEETELAYKVNRDGPAYLAAECAEQKIPLLHISTDYIFDGEKQTPYHEDDLPNPQSIYGKSKLAGEQAVQQALQQYIILRVAWVFGAGGNNFVRTMLRLAKKHDELGVVNDQHGIPTWAGDIAMCLLTIARRYQKDASIAWGVYHYSGEPAVSWHVFAQTIFAQAVNLGLLDTSPKVIPITTDEYPLPAKRPQNSVLNCRKIKTNLAINQPDWRIGLKQTLQKWKEQ